MNLFDGHLCLFVNCRGDRIKTVLGAGWFDSTHRQAPTQVQTQQANLRAYDRAGERSP